VSGVAARLRLTEREGDAGRVGQASQVGNTVVCVESALDPRLDRGRQEEARERAMTTHGFFKWNHVVTGLFALGLISGAANTTFAADACKNVKFKFTNNHDSGKSITVLRVKYFNKANGQWQTEDIANKVCAQGATCTTGGDNLRDSEGEDLTKFRFIYKYTEKDGDLSDEVEGGDKVPDNPTCNANRTYGPGTGGWTIFGTN
jgi:hypothetical protein